MSICCLVTVEGVLTQGDNLKTAMPLKLARPFYDGLRSQFRMIALTKADQEIARWWLKREHFANWSAVLSWSQAMTWEDWRVDVVRDFLANAWEVSYYIDSSPVVANLVSELGVTALVPWYPAHRLGWQPEESVRRSWEQVVDTVESRA